jgi:hypothetical protein
MYHHIAIITINIIIFSSNRPIGLLRSLISLDVSFFTVFFWGRIETAGLLVWSVPFDLYAAADCGFTVVSSAMYVILSSFVINSFLLWFKRLQLNCLSQKCHFFVSSDDPGFAAIPTTGLVETQYNVYVTEIITFPKLDRFRIISELAVFKIRVLLFT